MIYLLGLDLLLCLSVAQLGADSWPTREHASQTLAALGPLAVPALEAAATHEDPEVRSRARQLLTAEDCRVMASLFPPNWVHGFPWADMDPQRPLIGPPPAIHQNQWYQPYLERAAREDCWNGPGWPDFRRATELWAREELKAGRHAETRAAIRRMCAEEEIWRKRQRGIPD